MKILILSKTIMGDRCCVGGMSLEDGTYVRLLNRNEYGQDCNDFNPREVWEMTLIKAPIIEPHIEDVYVVDKTFLKNLEEEVSILDIIENFNIPIWEGGPDNLFDGVLEWTVSGSGYVEKPNLPNHSVGFWISDRDLIMYEFITEDKVDVRYRYSNVYPKRNFKFVGAMAPIDRIPKGTLLRVSLAKWWKGQEKCYLQLSGWYI